ncbi:MAG TPA: thioredoxin family protein [Chromatiaceae bacterium]|nr:thioredoxin family protein [Chromatiaceae bacterium]
MYGLNRIRKTFLALPILVVTSVMAGGSVSWKTWSDDVFAQAKAQNRLVLVDLSAEWCAYCKKMDATTWQDAAVLAAIEQDYVPVQIMDEKDPELAERYRQYGRPAVIIMDANGKELMRKRGYMKPQWMAWMLQAVVQEQESKGL